MESGLHISFPKIEGHWARAARALGRDQQEVAGFMADNTTQKNVQKDMGRPIILPNGVKVLGTMKYKNWQGLYEPLNQDKLSRQRRRLVVTEYALKAVQHCGPSVIARLQGRNPSRRGTDHVREYLIVDSTMDLWKS